MQPPDAPAAPTTLAAVLVGIGQPVELSLVEYFLKLFTYPLFDAGSGNLSLGDGWPT